MKDRRDILEDIVFLLQEQYNEAVEASNGLPDGEDKIYEQGKVMAYYDALDIIEGKLATFQEELQGIKVVTPQFGKKIKLTSIEENRHDAGTANLSD